MPEKPRGEHREVRRGRLLRVHAGGGGRQRRVAEVRGVQLSPEFSQEGGALINQLLL
ncbi:mini zinc finger protein 1 [Phtheirospermum japonicum]|uniref:Mini zinc finger protein 1 n=1 Tax=Phtheirospermum japonicum TaxID=374723 RepID=A0A830D0E3_9LAMI|nr:mini zinc finger protein 1 [Phtheirospermum japonicum]